MRFSLSILAAALLATTSFAQAGEAEVRAAIKVLNPSAVIDSIKTAPVKGWMEATLGGQIIYFSDDGKYLLQGALVETATRRNLTEDAQSLVRVAELNKIQKKDLIIFPAKGPTKHVVKVFTDIDCGYCRKLHTEIKQYSDLGIEIQYLWFPRAGVPSDSSRKAIAVFCAKDQRKALTDAKSGTDPGNATCPNPIESDYNMGQRMGVNGTPALLLADGTLMPGYLPAPQLLAELDKRALEAKKK
jgi:thiol:disulfide interchange protein DsbC